MSSFLPFSPPKLYILIYFPDARYRHTLLNFLDFIINQIIIRKDLVQLHSLQISLFL